MKFTYHSFNQSAFEQDVWTLDIETLTLTAKFISWMWYKNFQTNSVPHFVNKDIV